MAGDVTEAWQSLHKGLRGFIAKRVADDAAVDDILQDVFLAMHRGMDGLKDRRRLTSWVYQIARHAIIDHYRAPERRRERPVGLAADLEATGMAPAVANAVGDEAPHAELVGCLRAMVAQLDEDYREALTLVEFEGLTQQAAAKRVGLSLSGMKSRVQRGRQQVKRLFEACCLIQLDARKRILAYTVRNKGTPC